MLEQIQLLYQITPIWLQGGVAANVLGNGGFLPILSILNTEVYSALMTGNADNLPADWNFENSFAIFQPFPGGSLIEQSIAEYPFANLSVAANAVLRNPINVSMIMMTPMKQPNAWIIKQSTMTALKSTLDNHNNLGGTYIVFTPAYIYTDMLMTNLTDISTAQSPLPQNTWRWDFTRPLVSLQDIYGAENNLVAKITGGVPTTGITTSPVTALGIPSVANAGAPPIISGIPMGTLPQFTVQ
jgi:hypothetical protein